MDAHAKHEREERIGLEQEQGGDDPPEDAVCRGPPAGADHTAEAGVGEEVHIDHRDAEQREGAHQIR